MAWGQVLGTDFTYFGADLCSRPVGSERDRANAGKRASFFESAASNMGGSSRGGQGSRFWRRNRGRKGIEIEGWG